MSQYQRMVSYLYRYEDGVKKNNVGYARIELRGDVCRVTVQLGDALAEQPEVAFFQQEPQGVRRISAGRLSKSGNIFRCRIETSSNNIMNSGALFSDMDGLIIYVRDSLYYATTWKEIQIHLDQGDQQEETRREVQPEQAVFPENDSMAQGNGTPSSESQQSKVSSQPQEVEQGQQDTQSQVQEKEIRQSQEFSGIQEEEGKQSQRSSRMQVVDFRQPQDSSQWKVVPSRQWEAASQNEEERMTGEESPAQPETHTEWEMQQPVQSEEEAPQNDPEVGAADVQKKNGAESDSVAACQCEACRQCPQQRRLGDFGRYILDMFPRMYPFEIDRMDECVRLELKDLGCLPVPYWSLAGNPFLLHGYYCYRHILFTRMGDGEYCIGVPGIYNQENQKQAKHCGFGQFKTLSEVSNRQGAFGYWLYPVKG